MFSKTLYAGWGDMDFNGHMRNTAYSDKSGDVRMLYFAEHGFSMQEFMRQRIGPVVMKDELEYFREISLLQNIKVTLQSAGQAADGSRFILVNEFFREDGKLAARVTSTGGWLDLSARKLIAPPEALRELMENLVKTADFQPLPSSLK